MIAAQESDRPKKHTEAGYWNLPTKTMGGQQFWTDQLHFHQYRIQKNSASGHYRLLDPKNVRRAWGDFSHCQSKLQQIKKEKQLQSMTGEVVIMLHGLSRTRRSMSKLAEHVKTNSELTVINMTYASTRGSMDDHAKALDSVIRHLPNVGSISFVAHSMGNIVVRYYLGMPRAESGGTPRFNRMVMIGPPNSGSRLARYLQDNLVFKTLCGVSGQQLSKRWTEIEANLATPAFDFGIIAGGQKDDAWLSNSLLDGKDDFIVSVQETKLSGATDFLVQPLLHGTMMSNRDVCDATVRFLKSGYFVSEREKHPLPVQPIMQASSLDAPPKTRK